MYSPDLDLTANGHKNIKHDISTEYSYSHIVQSEQNIYFIVFWLADIFSRIINSSLRSFMTVSKGVS